MGAVLATDRFGNQDAAYEFDGFSTYITIPNSPSLQSPTTEISEMAWINIFGWSQVGQSFGPVFMKSNSEDNAFQYRLSTGPDGINLSVNNWNNSAIIDSVLNFEQWYFVAATWKDDTARFYVNGNFIGKLGLTGPAQADDLPLEIGRDRPGGIEYFLGKIDDARIYNRALAEEEIQAIYSGSEGVNEHEATVNTMDIFPNPAHDVFHFSFHISHPQFVTLKIYDTRGKEISTIVNTNLSAGTHQCTWNTDELLAGIYLYRLTSNDQAVTGKLILFK